MYFDAYLKGRNPPNSQLQPQGTLHSAENSSKFTPLRPPLPQNNPVISKQPYAELRSDNNKQNTSAHIFLSAAKPPSLPQRMTSNYPTRPQTSTGLIAPFSRHQLPEQQKYICHSPAKGGSRTSAGLVFDEVPQNRYDYRRSESITEMKPSQGFRDSSINYYNPQRQPPDLPPSTSPLQVRFNASTAYPGRMLRKESVDGPMLTNREEKTEMPFVRQPYTQKKMFKEGFAEFYQNKSNIPAFDPSKFEYIPAKVEVTEPKRFDFESRKTQNEGKRVDAYRTFEEVYKTSLQTLAEGTDLKKESSQDFLKKYSVSKLPEMDKSLDQDIELLRLTSKKTDQLLDREINKNAYLNQLFEQKGIRTTPEETKETIKEKKEMAAKNITYERDLEEKNRELAEKMKQLEEKGKELAEKSKELGEKSKDLSDKNRELADRNKELGEKNRQLIDKSKEIFQKNKEISEKTKIIIDKNKQIELLGIELRQIQEKLAKKNQSDATQRREIDVLQTELKDRYNKIAELELKLKEAEQAAQAKLQQQNEIVNLLRDSAEQSKQKIEKLQSQLATITLTTQEQEKTIKSLISSNQEHITHIDELSHAHETLRQQSESEKLSLIKLYKKESADLKAKFQAEKQSYSKGQEKQSTYLQAEIIELKQRNTMVEEELASLKKDFQQLSQNFEIVRGQYCEVGSILLLGEGFAHEKLMARMRECMQGFARSQGMQAKEVQRFQEYQLQKLQHQHLERRHQELSRQLKKVGSRLAGASMEAMQGSRLLRDANNEILLMHLLNLNEKYRFQLENQ